MNIVCLIGRLTENPEIRYTKNENKAITQFTLAVKRDFLKEEKNQSDFITILAWDKTAEFCGKNFKKGQQIGLVGEIETGSYDDKDGKRIYTTKVIAKHVYFADGKKEEKEEKQENIITDDQLPF